MIAQDDSDPVRLVCARQAQPAPGVAAGLGITLRTSAGIPPRLKRLDRKDGLPPLPHVDVCRHAGGDPKSPALKQLRRTVTEHALVELAGKREERGQVHLANNQGK